MPENKFLRIVVLLLLLLNTGTLGFVLLHQPPGSHREADQPPQPGGPAYFLRRELALTDEQETRYRTLRNNHHDQVAQIHRQILAQQQRLYALMSKSDTTGIYKLSMPIIDSLGAAQRTIAAITFEHFREVRALCTPTQQQRFDEVIMEALSQLH